MERVKKAFKCGYCDKLLIKPVFLPCGHSICNIHQEEIRNSKKEEKTCSICSTLFEIPINGLIPNKSLEELIEENFLSIDTVYGSAMTECQKLVELYERFTLLKDSYIHEKISEQRSKIDLEREQTKMKIDEKALKLIEQLNEFEKDCTQNFIMSLSQEHERKIEHLEEEITKLKSMLLSNQRAKWKTVVDEAKFKISKLSVDIEEFEQRLFLKRLDELKTVEIFTQYIDGDMIKNNLLSLKVKNLSIYKDSDKDFIDIFGPIIEVIGIKWKIRFQIEKNDMSIGIYFSPDLISNLNDMKITYNLVILCQSDSTKSFKYDKLTSLFKKGLSLFGGKRNLMKLHDLMNNKDLYDCENDSLTAQVVIHCIEWI